MFAFGIFQEPTCRPSGRDKRVGMVLLADNLLLLLAKFSSGIGMTSIPHAAICWTGDRCIGALLWKNNIGIIISILQRHL